MARKRYQALRVAVVTRTVARPIWINTAEPPCYARWQGLTKIAVDSIIPAMGRALLLLQKAGLISVDKKAGITATIFDIVSNPKNLPIVELDAVQLPRSLEDMDLAITNSSFAMEAKLVATRDAFLIEDSDFPYANVLAVSNVDKDNPALRELARALTSKEVAEFIAKEYQGSVAPAFDLNF